MIRKKYDHVTKKILGLTVCMNVAIASCAGVAMPVSAETVTDALPASGLNMVRGSSGRAYETATQVNADNLTEDPDADIKGDLDSLISDEKEEIVINTVDDLLNMAHEARLDTWSVNKIVRLNNDISLEGQDFLGIPTFGGIFDGRGHTVSGLEMSDKRSYMGFFLYVQETGRIMNLKVEGHVSADNKEFVLGGIAASNAGIIDSCTFSGVAAGGDYAGGIAGINELSGQITGCKSSGYVSGSHYTGGIAGENMGDISGCTNYSEINTTHREHTLSVQNIKLETYVNSALDFDEDKVRENPSVFGTIYDTGGIAGMSIGVIRNCTNEAKVGYEQVGYNTGGIAGRQSGYITGCTNNGEILGRKDVGGIVGQAEPYVALDMSQDIAARLNESIGELHDLIDETLSDLGDGSDTIASRLSMIKQFTGSALNDTRYLADDTTNYLNGVTGSVNEAFSRIDYILEESAKNGGAIDETISAASNAHDAGAKIQETVRDIDIYDYMTDEEKEEYNRYKDTIDSANKEYDGYLTQSKNAMYNYYVWKYASDALDIEGENDLAYLLSDDDMYTFNSKEVTSPPEKAVSAFSWDSSHYPENEAGSRDEFFDTFGASGTWFHHTEEDGAYQDVIFPISDEENERFKPDKTINEAARAKSGVEAAKHADEKYQASHGVSYAEDLARSADGISALITKYLPVMSEEIKKDAGAAVDSIQASIKNIENTGRELKRVVGNVASEDSIAFPSIGSDYRAHTTSLADNLQGMNENFGILNSELNNATKDTVLDLQDVNDQFNKIMLLYSDAIDGVLDRDYSNVIEDESLAEAENCTDATVADCTNNAAVCGDIDTGGIAGTMAIEYDFDPESDVTGISDANMNATFIAKCVLRNNRNTADIEGKKSYAAGVCALQEMGTITGCENFGNIRSSSGEYAGGIAGQSLSYVLKGVAKGDVSAERYAGGIAGEGTHIMDSIALVTVSDAESWYGAVAGHITDKGKVRNNYYVNRDLAAIDRVDYAMKAQRADIGDLDELVDYDIPREFTRPKVTYLLEDGDEVRTVGTAYVAYGGNLISEEYPAIDPKDGYYVNWDADSLSDITSDMQMKATYVRSITTLAGNELTDHGQSRVLVDGFFKAGDILSVEKYLSENGTVTDDTLIMDSFGISIPVDGLDSHTVRYAVDDEHIDDWEGLIEPYIIKDGQWVSASPVTRMGKYMLFDVDGYNVKIQIRMNDYRKVTIRNKAIIAGSAAALIAVICVAVYVFIKRRRKIAKAVNVIKEKTHEAAHNIGSQELFYHAEEDRFGNEIVREDEGAGEDVNTQKDSPEAGEGDATEDTPKDSAKNGEDNVTEDDNGEDIEEDEEGSSDWGL